MLFRQDATYRRSQQEQSNEQGQGQEQPQQQELDQDHQMLSVKQPIAGGTTKTEMS